jgi:post-segregation antitoxin (ccd killing protein)
MKHYKGLPQITVRVTAEDRAAIDFCKTAGLNISKIARAAIHEAAAKIRANNRLAS